MFIFHCQLQWIVTKKLAWRIYANQWQRKIMINLKWIIFILFYRHQIKQVMQLQQKLRMMLKLTTKLTTAISILTLLLLKNQIAFLQHSCQTVVKVHLHNCLFCHPLFADWTTATQKNNSRLNKVCSYSICVIVFTYQL